MACTEICIRYRKSPRYDTEKSGFCITCQIFIDYEGQYCPCCKLRLRRRPRTARRLRKYFVNHPDKIPKRL